MSLFNRFSVAYNIDKASKNNESDEIDRKTFKQRSRATIKEFISEEVVNPLLGFGFDVEQIMMGFKLYKFNTVDEAVYILMKDPETGKYNHRYISKSEQGYKKISDQACFLCGDESSLHLQLDMDLTDIRLEVTRKRKPDEDEEIKETSINCDRSNNPILKTSDISSILEAKNNQERKLYQVQKVEIPQDLIDLFEDPEVCRICFSEVINSSNQASFSCGHKFCRTCVTNHLNINITNGKVLTIICLYGGCPKTFNDEEVKEYVPNDTYNKYRKFKFSQLKLNNPDKFYVNCPFPDCEEIVDGEVVEEEDEFMRECNEGHKFCINCKSIGWHKNSKCKNYDDLLLNQIQKNSDSINYKKCPQCSVIIEKNEGCNQMKCVNCNYDFCWLCMKKYTIDHYAIYNFTGCPGMRFNTPEKKKWLKNPFCKVLWFICSFFIGVLAVVGLILFFAFFGCCYEFVNCYINRSQNEEDQENEYNRNNSQYDDNVQIDRNPEVPERVNDNRIIALLIFLGILCQPLYLIFYILYALMECYRKFSCWFYYVDY